MSNPRRHLRGAMKIGFAFCTVAYMGAIYAPTAYALTGADKYSIAESTPFYNPNANCGGQGTGGGTTISIDNNAAQAIAQKDSTGNTKVGYALYNSSGSKVASYNDTFENYGASITKSMLLVAYLTQVGSGAIPAAAQANLTGMIEDSNDQDSNNVYNLLTNPTKQLNDVASAAGMSGFKLNTTGDSLYYIGQSQITANDFANFFSKIDSYIPASQVSFANKLLSTISPNAGLLQSGLPGTVLSKEGWKPEPGGGSDPARSGSPNPFGNEGAPYIVNQAAQFNGNGVTYGVAVTVAGTSDESSGESIIENVVAALVKTGNPATTATSGQTCACGSGSQTSLTGSDPEMQTWNFLKGMGLTDAQVAGVMGNFEQESSFDSERLQGGGDSQNPSAAGGGGYGLAQWTPGASIITDAQANHITGPIYQLLTQLELVQAQMSATSGTTPTGFQYMIKNWPPADLNSASGSAQFFDANFEGGTDPGGVRESNAQAILAKYGGTGSGASQSCGQGTSGNCSTATGDPRIYACALQYKPVSYSESAAGNHLPGGNPAWLKTCPVISAKCFLDCSGLVNIAVYDAFGYNLEGNTVTEYNTPNLWQHISFSDVHQGDLIQPGQYFSGGEPQHVEIINSVQGNTINTFGAHDPQQGVGPATYTLSPGDVFLHWIGPMK